MNDIIDIEIILKRKKYPKVYSIGIILIVILLIITYIITKFVILVNRILRKNLIKKWWEEQDSNLCSPKATDLQSVAFDRSAILPNKTLKTPELKSSGP